jgi:hypothetical protein
VTSSSSLFRLLRDISVVFVLTPTGYADERYKERVLLAARSRQPRMDPATNKPMLLRVYFSTPQHFMRYLDTRIAIRDRAPPEAPYERSPSVRSGSASTSSSSVILFEFQDIRHTCAPVICDNFRLCKVPSNSVTHRGQRYYTCTEGAVGHTMDPDAPRLYAPQQRLPGPCVDKHNPWYYINDRRADYSLPPEPSPLPRLIIHSDGLTSCPWLTGDLCVREARRLAQAARRQTRASGGEVLYPTDDEGTLEADAPKDPTQRSNRERFQSVRIEEDATAGRCAVCAEDFDNYAAHLALPGHQQKYAALFASSRLHPAIYSAQTRILAARRAEEYERQSLTSLIQVEGGDVSPSLGASMGGPSETESGVMDGYDASDEGLGREGRAAPGRKAPSRVELAMSRLSEIERQDPSVESDRVCATDRFRAWRRYATQTRIVAPQLASMQRAAHRGSPTLLGGGDSMLPGVRGGSLPPQFDAQGAYPPSFHEYAPHLSGASVGPQLRTRHSSGYSPSGVPVAGARHVTASPELGAAAYQASAHGLTASHPLRPLEDLQVAQRAAGLTPDAAQSEAAYAALMMRGSGSPPPKRSNA